MNRVIKTACVAFVVCAAVYGTQAQDQPETRVGVPNGPGREQREWIESQKVAFITDRLELTPAESEKFWPLYKQYWAQELSLAHAKRKLYDRMAETTDAVAAEADVAALVALERQRAELIERYAKVFAAALPWPKVSRFFVEQENFKGYLLRNHVRK